MKRRSFGAHWLRDPRLPDDKGADDRIFGDKRPKQKPPSRAVIVASCKVRHRKFKVETNRTKNRFWFTVLVGDRMMDYASTSSQKTGQGWADAVSLCPGGKPYDFEAEKRARQRQRYLDAFGKTKRG